MNYTPDMHLFMKHFILTRDSFFWNLLLSYSKAGDLVLGCDLLVTSTMSKERKRFTRNVNSMIPLPPRYRVSCARAYACNQMRNIHSLFWHPPPPHEPLGWEGSWIVQLSVSFHFKCNMCIYTKIGNVVLTKKRF